MRVSLRCVGLVHRAGAAPQEAARGRVCLTSPPPEGSLLGRSTHPNPPCQGQACRRPHNEHICRRKPLRHEREENILYPNKKYQTKMQREANPIRQSHKLRSQETRLGSRALSLKHLPGSCPWAALSSCPSLCSCWAPGSPTLGIWA